MPRTVTLTELTVKSVNIDVESKIVTVHYQCTDDSGLVRQNGTAFFTRPLPEGAGEEFFLISADRGQEVLAMLADIRVALDNRFLTEP